MVIRNFVYLDLLRDPEVERVLKVKEWGIFIYVNGFPNLEYEPKCEYEWVSINMSMWVKLMAVFCDWLFKPVPIRTAFW